MCTRRSILIKIFFFQKYKIEAVLNGEGEKNEVKTIQWIPIKDSANYKWAFNHEDRILEAISWYNINVFEKDLDAQIVP